MMRRKWLGAILLLAYALAGRAGEPEAAVRAPAEQPAATVPQPAAPATQPEPASGERQATEEGQARARFEPSERISEDLSVSFPADI